MLICELLQVLKIQEEKQNIRQDFRGKHQCFPIIIHSERSNWSLAVLHYLSLNNVFFHC